MREIFYFRLLIAICPLSPLHVALSSFFIGRKKTVIPLMSTLIGNLVNLVLNYLLIFGLKPLGMPELGVKGAAFATATAQCASVAILILAFFSKSNRTEYRTLESKFEPALLLKILKIGYPNAIAQAMIAAAWSCFFILMNRLGEASITLAGVMQTLTGFFVFIIQGLSRGMIAVSANLIGGGKSFLIFRVLLSGVQLSILFSVAILLAFVIYPAEIMKLFFNADDFERAHGYFGALQFALVWGWLAFLSKSIRALLSGLLTSSGQTKFVMWNEAISIWLFFIMPVWLCSHFFQFNVTWAYFIACLYNILAVAAYCMKIYKMDWATEGQEI